MPQARHFVSSLELSRAATVVRGGGGEKAARSLPAEMAVSSAFDGLSAIRRRWRSLDSPVGGGRKDLGPSTSRVRFPGIADEVVAAAMLRRNKSSRALPRPGGVSLRRHRRARGGCAPAVELMYRRSSPSARRPVRQVSTAALQSFVEMEFRLIWGRR